MNKQYPAPIAELEKTVGYTFKDPIHILVATTHSSYSNEAKDGVDCNERLEFLGDSVLSFVTSRYLYENFPNLPEGEMSKIRASAVCEKTLCSIAKRIELGTYLRLGHGEECQNGRNRPSILADAFEALLAAIYLDGGIEPVRKFLLPIISAEIDTIVESGADRDYKTALQQFVQQERGSLLEYKTVNESGPAHDKTFFVEVSLNGNVIGRGNGHSKRKAEQNAAKEALTLFDFTKA
ncbi:MAG: ribonuclease III [Clostridia bacterium]|nr:ribonuclease III [Clostridia bacterium]